MPSSLLESFLAALQSSLSVLLTLAYGVGAARIGLLTPQTAKEVSHVCVELFLPALLVTSMGKDLAEEGRAAFDLWPIVVWAALYPLLSLAFIWPFIHFAGFPRWSLSAAAFNNTTALPLLLLQSLRTTGILESISGSRGPDAAADLATTYFLLNAMVNNVLTFALGPKLLSKKEPLPEEESHVGGFHPDPIISAVRVEDEEVAALRAEAAEAEEDTADDANPDEHSSLLQKAKPGGKLAHAHAIEMKHTIILRMNGAFHYLPGWMQAVIVEVWSVVNPPLVGAALAIIIAVTPPLRIAFFNTPKEGGVLRAWVTSSLQNVGDLFNALQMFVVGSKLYESMLPTKPKDGKPKSNGSPDAAKTETESQLHIIATITILFLRFVIMPGLSILVFYFLASRTTILGDDSMMWFVLMLAAAGPSAINIASLSEVAGEHDGVQGAIARFLTISYFVTPIICFTVVGSLKACEAALAERGL